MYHRLQVHVQIYHQILRSPLRRKKLINYHETWYEIFGFHSSEDVDVDLLGCNSM
jgi:hypothetical protein